MNFSSYFIYIETRATPCINCVVGYIPFLLFERRIHIVPVVMRSGREAAIQFPYLIYRISSFFIETRATPCNKCVVGYTPFLSFERPIHRVPGVMRSGREAEIQFP
jgi:hypothetical protein